MKNTKNDLLLQAKIYKFMTLLFALLGGLIFLILYLNNIEGRLLEAMKEPQTILFILIPFAPAFVLSLITKSKEKKYLAFKEPPAETDKKS